MNSSPYEIFESSMIFLKREELKILMKQKYEGQSPSQFCIVEISNLTFQNTIELSNISYGLEFIAKKVEN